MPAARRKAPAKGSVEAAIAAVVAAKQTATGQKWSLLHGAESRLTRAAGRRRATTHPSKRRAPKSGKKKGGKKA
jgi:hypothetical protein